MRKVYIIILCFVGTVSLAQGQKQIVIRSQLFDQESQPIFGAYIINFTDQKITTTDSEGKFSLRVFPGDSLMIQHISCKRIIVGIDTIPPVIILEPSVTELKPIVISPNNRDLENVKKMMEEVKSVPIEKMPDDIKGTERMKMVVDKHGTHNKGFSEYFGYNIYPFIGKAISKSIEKKERKKKLAHYYFYKEKQVGKKDTTKIAD